MLLIYFNNLKEVIQVKICLECENIIYRIRKTYFMLIAPLTNNMAIKRVLENWICVNCIQYHMQYTILCVLFIPWLSTVNHYRIKSTYYQTKVFFFPLGIKNLFVLVELMSGEKCEWDRKDQFKIWMNKLLFYNLVNSWASFSVSKETQLKLFHFLEVKMVF